ncbi:MAG: hypothetical protein KF878_02795 [Planctomycetes bacterium]|nr:hypothetical protein [Planctomycetota bacterium]
MSLLLAAAGGAAAQEGPLPGERRHVLKTARELVRLATTKDEAGRCEALIDVAGERVRELERLPADRLEGVGRGYHELMGGVRASIERASARDRDMSPVVARYVEAADRHAAALERALGRASDDAARDLRLALETSRRAREEAGAAFLRGRDRARLDPDDERRGREGPMPRRGATGRATGRSGPASAARRRRPASGRAATARARAARRRAAAARHTRTSPGARPGLQDPTTRGPGVQGQAPGTCGGLTAAVARDDVQVTERDPCSDPQ